MPPRHSLFFFFLSSPPLPFFPSSPPLSRPISSGFRHEDESQVSTIPADCKVARLGHFSAAKQSFASAKGMEYKWRLRWGVNTVMDGISGVMGDFFFIFISRERLESDVPSFLLEI